MVRYQILYILTVLNYVHTTVYCFECFLLTDKSRWERVSDLRFKKGDMKLWAYPFLITLYVETNEPVPQHTGEQPSIA